jgi:hypothetical protein
MTVCGFAKTRDGSALIWSDSEGYIAGRPVPEPIQKLVVSPGNLVGVGHGYKTLLDSFRSLLVGLGYASFASAIRSVPPLLRRALAADRAARSEPCETAATFAVCGSYGGEICGAVFDPRQAFEPQMRASWASPHLGQGAPATAQDVLRIAQLQIGVIIDEVASSATGGQLTVAKIGADRIVKTIVPLLIGDERRSLSLGNSFAHERARLAAIERLRGCFP